jgi:predicted phosphodiesterase
MWDKFVFMTDNHGDQQDPGVIKTATKFLDLWKPTVRIHGGDNWDLRPLRRGAGEEEKRESMTADFDAGAKWLNTLKPTHFLRGNHDERLWDLAAENRGPLSDHAKALITRAEKIFKDHKTRVLPYDKREGVLSIGKLRAIHGYAAGVTAARRQALAYGTVLAGHTHGIQSASIEGIDNRIAHIVGCMCLLNMPYSRATLASLVHRHGWRYGVIHRKSGVFFSWQAEQINGIWVFPTDIKEIR